MTKRRNTLRRSVRLPVSFGRKIPAITADVSRGGFQAEMPQVFVPGSTVHGYFLLDEKEVPFEGKVAWAQAGNPQLSVYSKFGVRFAQPPLGLRELFASLDSKPRKVKAKNG
jgi:hypothetical protein